MQQEPTIESSISDEPLSHWLKTAPHITSSSQLPAHADIAVIGGGLLGASTCYWAARANHSVVLLERTALASGATGRNGGFVSIGPGEAYTQAIARLGYKTAQAILAVTLENHALLRQVLDEETIACDYREPGHLNLALTEEELQTFAQSSSALQREGVNATLLSFEQIGEFIHTAPGPKILGALFVPQAGLIHPAKLIQGLVAAAQRHGAHSVTASVQHLSQDGEGIRLQTTRGTIHAGSVIVAANAWIPQLLPQLQQVVMPVRGQMLAYQPQPSLFTTGMSVDLSGFGEYWQQTPDGTIVLGGCRAAAEGYDIGIQVSQPTAVVQQALEQVFPQLFPQLTGLQVAQRWAGLMAFTPDFLPVADRVPGIPHLWVVGGFSGHGMPFGLRFGQLLAEAATTQLTPAALLPFQLNRPTLQYLPNQ